LHAAREKLQMAEEEVRLYRETTELISLQAQTSVTPQQMTQADRLVQQFDVIELERKVVAAIELLAKEGISRDRAESLIVEKTRSRLRERVLVVDDEPVIRRVIAKGLRPLNVIEADNGRDALMKMKTERASLVITDIKMPELDGFELLASLRRQYPQIPVIAISGYTDVAEIQSHGFDAFLEKPVNLEVLKSLVNDIFVSRES
jgi:CheY-like chemotaxis protein